MLACCAGSLLDGGNAQMSEGVGNSRVVWTYTYLIEKSGMGMNGESYHSYVLSCRKRLRQEAARDH